VHAFRGQRCFGSGDRAVVPDKDPIDPVVAIVQPCGAEPALATMEKARLDLENGYYEWACFTAQQAAEKIINALALKKGLSIWGHSLTEMLGILTPVVAVPDEIKDRARLLDLYYIPARYPNGFPSGKPADYFTQRQAQEAIDAADSIIGFCESHMA
jgi:HEPN domain-containing protein